ncbi:MAG: amylo-alpha-1,6-glucosidase [Planctomycetota bacterium]
MIISVLERLERSGGRSVRLEGPPRWLVGPRRVAPGDPYRETEALGTASSSGRFASPCSLRADRTDDGLLVTAPAGLSGERIVWIGDVDVELPAGHPPPDHPTISLDPVRSRVEARWRTAAERAVLRLQVLARPAGDVTFENEGFDGRVETTVTEGRTMVRMRPYGGLASLCIEFDGEARFEPDPRWRRGVAVRHPSGASACEDRFSPGTFTVSLPSTGTLRLVVRVEPPDPESNAAARPGDGTARGALVEALSLPGSVARGALGPDEVAAWFEAGLSGPVAGASRGPRFGDDVLLWRARAAVDVAEALLASGDDRRSAEVVGDVLEPALRGWFDDVIARAADFGGAPEAVFRGALRWYELLDGSVDRSDARRPGTAGSPPMARGVAVETAALLHQLLAQSAWLAERAGDRGRAERARALTVRSRRWFQRSFWLPTPRRLADVEIGSVLAGAAAPLALRPHMVLAAALRHAPLDADQRRFVVRAAEERLLTPLGLRSLDAEDELFDPASRSDGATWPWLLGPYLEASMRAFGHDRGRDRLGRCLLVGLETAPEAWCESGVAPTPIGTLAFPPAFGEASRVRELLAKSREGGSPR